MILPVEFVKENDYEEVLLLKEGGKDEDEIVPNYLVTELKSVYYLLNENSSNTKLHMGNLFIHDNPAYK